MVIHQSHTLKRPDGTRSNRPRFLNPALKSRATCESSRWDGVMAVSEGFLPYENSFAIGVPPSVIGTGRAPSKSSL